MTRNQISTLAKALKLMNDHPRFGTRNRRFEFDSYSVAEEIETILKKEGYDLNNMESLLVS